MKQLLTHCSLSLLALGVASAALAVQGATNQVNTDGFRDTPIIPGAKWHLHDPDRPQPLVVTPGSPFSQGAPAPSDAEVLFDGKDLAKWQTNLGQDATWRVVDGYMETAPRGGGIRTRGKWADFQLHVEWAAPNPSRGTGQGRGNSGVLINGLYEVQVLDSYQALTYPDGQAGAIYGQSPPLVNASKPPGEWQTYDIIFESPRWNEQGELVKKPASPCSTTASSCRTTSSSPAAPMASAALRGDRWAIMSDGTPLRSLSSCWTTTILFAIVISGFASSPNPTNRE
jgi:hypothetical protein